MLHNRYIILNFVYIFQNKILKHFLNSIIFCYNLENVLFLRMSHEKLKLSIRIICKYFSTQEFFVSSST